MFVAFVMAAAFPLMLPFSRENGEASAEAVVTEKAIESEAVAVMPRPPISGTPESVNDAAQAASMVLAGTLLIGIGSAMRRAA